MEIYSDYFYCRCYFNHFIKSHFVSITTETSSAERGEILDQNGVILATNKKVKSLYCTSNEDKLSKQDTANTLAFLINFQTSFNIIFLQRT